MINECVICREERETKLGAVHVYEESGQATPFLKIEVCDDCLNPKNVKTTDQKPVWMK